MLKGFKDYDRLLQSSPAGPAKTESFLPTRQRVGPAGSGNRPAARVLPEPQPTSFGLAGESGGMSRVLWLQAPCSAEP